MVDMMLLMGDKYFFGLVPMGEGHTYGFGVIDGERFEDPLVGRLDRFRRRFAGFGAPVPAYLAALQSDQQLHFGPIEWVELDEWYRGRVVLIDDAAHAGPPHMGEGGCMAMEDALVLAEVLRTAESLASALEAYVLRRRPRAEWSKSRVATRHRLGPCLPQRATPRCANEEIRCFATGTGRSYLRPRHFRLALGECRRYITRQRHRLRRLFDHFRLRGQGRFNSAISR
jgi:2-polyprenyl-6-methoxyphenol hydroxylase-like FAD-dependent oxidoreductase